MPHRLSRSAALRAAVLLTAVTSPLLGAGAAQAAIAGAQPEKATQVPVLTSAIIDAATPNAVDVCYDKAVLPGTAKNRFDVLGYRLYSYAYASNVTSLSANCVKASFAVANLGPFTVLVAGSGAVTSAGGTNSTDSTPLQGSTSHSGTRNVASGPNLAGVAPSTASAGGNQYIFTFDKDVTSSPTASDFYIVGADGKETDGQSATPVASNAVAVTFAVADSSGQSTAHAFLGGARPGAVVGQYDSPNSILANHTANVGQSAQIPYASNPPAEFAPYVTGATLNAENASTGAESVTYTFSQGVNPAASANPGSGTGQPQAAQFKLELANGAVLSADSVTTQAAGPTTTVTANFTSSSSTYSQEFGVVAFADTGAVSTYSATSPSSGVASAASSAPIGANSGAFAEGFTIAPDVTGIAIAQNADGGAADVLTINLDDRTAGGAGGVAINPNPSNPGPTGSASGATYYSSTGSPLAPQPTAIGCTVSQGSSTYATTTPGPAPETVTCAYAPNALSGVAAVGFGLATFNGTAAGGTDAFSLPQIDSPIASSAIARAYRINVAHMKAKHHRAKKHSKHTRKR